MHWSKRNYDLKTFLVCLLVSFTFYSWMSVFMLFLSGYEQVTSQGCNIAVKDPNCWFDYGDPYGPFDLNLSCSYDRAVAFALLRLAASHQRIIFSECSYDNAELHLQQVLSPIEPLMCDLIPTGLSHLESLEDIKTLLCKKGYAATLFKRVDTESKELIDVDQLRKALQIIGFDFNNKICLGLMSRFDIDKSGFINVKEFKLLLENRSCEVIVRIKNLSGQLIMTQKSTKIKESSIPVQDPRSQMGDQTRSPSNLGTLDASIPRYVPPSNGKLHLKVVDSQTIKSLYKVS